MPPISLSPQSVVSAWIPRRYKKWRPWGAIFITCHSSRPTIPKFMNKFKGGKTAPIPTLFTSSWKEKAIQMEARGAIGITCHSSRPTIPKFMNKFKGGENSSHTYPFYSCWNSSWTEKVTQNIIFIKCSLQGRRSWINWGEGVKELSYLPCLISELF